MIRKIKKYWESFAKRHGLTSIQFTISASFTLIAVVCMSFIGIMLYNRFVSRTEKMTVRATEQLLNQTNTNLETYLRNMMRISDTMYYSVIKNKDISAETMDGEMNLLYEANKDYLVNISCFKEDGTLVEATPVNTLKKDIDVRNQAWFTAAAQKMENLHFSTPHVQNLFDDTSYRYYWVVSLSRMVEFTSAGNNVRGILLVDMNFSGIEQLFKRSNSLGESGYIYLVDSEGKLIYHPKQKLIAAGIVKENNEAVAGYEDGSHKESFDGEKRVVTVKTVAYTGWKIVNVTPNSAFDINLSQTRFFVILIVFITMVVMILVNQSVSAQIARPIKRLDDSVKGLENGNLDVVVYDGGGSNEIEHLGKTLNSMVVQLRKLMEKVVMEQEEKRRSELDALQSQINPHFLYNTLDSIVWMIEGERYQEAICMVTDLASLFRISLSKGKNIISIKDELLHARNYMNIQKIRYKDKFSIEYDIEEEIYEYATVKLIIQPLLENAIYYGIEYMYGDGEILVKGYKRGEDIYIEVTDNGMGMTKEVVDRLLTDHNRVRAKGSGVGLINVHKRIQLRYGEAYGLTVESCPDEGTTVRIHLPAIRYERREG
ncbi:MAG: sensor histidine kinase [Acetivibrio ethanolgignens]